MLPFLRSTIGGSCIDLLRKPVDTVRCARRLLKHGAHPPVCRLLALERHASCDLSGVSQRAPCSMHRIAAAGPCVL